MKLAFTLLSFSTSITWLFASAIPVLHNSLKSQLVPSNPALSSVYFPLPSSVLLKNMSKLGALPALRVPPNWSFSIGLSGDTFLSEGEGSFSNLNISVQLEDGNPVPQWLHFDPSLMTLNGETPNEVQSSAIKVMASVSDAAVSDTFIFITSPHDLALVGSFRARNITTGLPFSAVIEDFERVILDDFPVNKTLFSHTIPTSAVNFSLLVNTSTLPWASWDFSALSLSGTGPQSPGRYTLPVIASASFPNQHLNLATELTLNVFPSYFNTSWLPPQHIVPGSTFGVNLSAFTLTEARDDPNWVLSLDDSSTVPWVAFDPTRLFLNGTIPRDVDSNSRIAITARHMAHNVTNVISFDLVIDIAQTHDAKGRRLSHVMSSLVLRRVLGACLGLAFVVIVALLSAIMYRRHARSKRKSFKPIGVAYSYREPTIYNTQSRNPIQRVFDNFSLSSSPSLGGRLPTTKAVFDAIRNRLRGERYMNPSLMGRSQERTSPNLFKQENKFMARHPQRPRKSKIGRPIAVLNGSSGLFSDFIANNLPRTVSFRQLQEKDSTNNNKPTPATFPPSRFSNSCPQLAPHSTRHSHNLPRPPNPVFRSASGMSFNDVIPAVPPKETSGSPSMKVGEFLANKRRATLRSAASTVTAKISSEDSRRVLNEVHSHLSKPSLSIKESTRPSFPNLTRVVRPHFGDSSLEDIKEAETENALDELSTHPPEQPALVTHDPPAHSTASKTKGSVDQAESPDPSTEEYFGSASNVSVIGVNHTRKMAGHTEKAPNVHSVAMTVPSVYSDDQHSTSFPISSYSITARQPFAFTPNIPKPNASHAVFLIAKQHNGADLPPWLRFDKATNEFWGVTPDVKKGNAINVEIDIWDPKTNNVVAGTDVEVLG